MNLNDVMQNAFAEVQSAAETSLTEKMENAKMRNNIKNINHQTSQIEKLNEKILNQTVEITALNRVIAENTADIKHLHTLVAELENHLQQEFADRAAADADNKCFTIRISLATAVISFALAHIDDICRFLGNIF